jgi:membrane-associated phospholipid phosphatase
LSLTRAAIPVSFALVISLPLTGFCQGSSELNVRASVNPLRTAFNVDRLSLPPATATDEAPPAPVPSELSDSEHQGRVSRSVKRILEDQKSLYLAPFKPANIKWDVLVLVPTGILLAEDRHIERHLPGGNLNFYSVISNVTIGTTAAGLAATWIYGLKTEDSHAVELGNMEIESLIDTFLIYTPMQFIAGRQRPGEGNGHGDFLRHHNINTSFPAGHAMFTWDMASVAAHEYPKKWVKILAYGAALTVTTTRFIGRDHWASDTFAGAALGYFIGSHVFHTRCDPELDKGCSRPGE